MSHRDVRELLTRESDGEAVASWQAQPLWDLCKNDVNDDHNALLLSKLMRIGQHHYLESLYLAVQVGVPDCLMQFLHPEYAYFKPVFVGLAPQTLRYTRLERIPRNDTYARMKAARVVRIAFEALQNYAQKPKRNVQAVPSGLVEHERQAYVDILRRAAAEEFPARELLTEILRSQDGPDTRDNKISLLMAATDLQCPRDREVRTALTTLTTAYARILHARFKRGESVSWDDLAAL